MAVVFEVRNKHGESIGRCDKKCYAADPMTPCSCVCRGENHAKGLVEALENAEGLATGWTVMTGNKVDVEAHPGGRQVPLWPKASR